jgi:pilus assembly protein CpaB
MRRLPSWFWLILALVFGTTATVMALGWLKGQSQQQAQKQPAIKLRPVVVAAKDIEAAQSLAPEQVVIRHWPQESCPPGSFTRPEEVAGRVAASQFKAGEPILEVKLAPQGAMAGLTALLSPEKRAMTVKVDEASGVAGFLAPGNRVDVVVTIDKGDFNKDPVSKIALQNLKVLGTGQSIERRPGDKPQVVPTVTLEVTPEEGERLALAAREGHVSLALRNHLNQEAVPTSGVKTTHLVAGPAGLKGVLSGGGNGQTGVEVIRGPYYRKKKEEKLLEKLTQQF